MTATHDRTTAEPRSAAGDLRLQRCLACGRTWSPSLPSCPYCAAERTEEVMASGAGSIYSFVAVRRRLSPGANPHVDHTIAVVDLAEGCRVLCRGEAGPQVAIGAPVMVLVPDAGPSAGLRFRVTAEERTA